MVKKNRSHPTRTPRQRSGRPYTAGEWFMVALGLALVVLVIGMVVSAVLE